MYFMDLYKILHMMILNIGKKKHKQPVNKVLPGDLWWHVTLS